MGKLIIFNCMLLLIIFIGLFLCKKFIRTEKSKNLTLFFSSVLTILCHYSTLIYLCITNGDSLEYLKQNPNLLLPIYPCNVVMWGCLIYGIMKNKESKGAMFLADYLFWFGIFSTLVGMFANVDFINNPSLNELTLNSSPYGLPFYISLGFIPLSEEQEINGIRFTPMKYIIKKN
jgi:cytochrome c biogenesis factor